MPPHIHYLSPTLTFPIPHHHRRNRHLLHRRREPSQQPPAQPSLTKYRLCCRATRWDDSNAESFTAYSFNQNDQENIEEEDYTLNWDFDVFQEYIDSIWILKVFRGYGFTLPLILAPLVWVNGLESFLLAMFASIWASTFSFAVQKMSNSQEHMRSNTKKKKAGSSSSRNELGSAKKPERSYKTWVQSDDDSSFGGWDEVDYGNGYSKGGRRSEMKKKSRRRRRESATSSPLLLRLLVSFLSSWTKML